jgi:Starch-binding associating with outer membrane
MKKKIVLYTLLVMVSGFSSCRKYLSELDVHPYRLQTAPPAQYMPQIFYSMMEGETFDQRFIGNYVQHWASTATNNNYDRHGNRVTAGAGGLTQAQRWRNHYFAIGSNVNQMIIQADRNKLNSYKGIGHAIHAWSWEVSTDAFGEMGFTTAWDNTLTKYPYDHQRVIYAGIHNLADAALGELDVKNGSDDPLISTADLMYQGDIGKWRKFIYAVKARLEIHKSNKSSFNADKVIEYVDKSFSSNADNAYVPSRPTKFVMSLLNGTVFNGITDPRIGTMFNAPLGVTPTKGNDAAAPTLYGKYFFKDNAAYPLMSYAEMQFIKAEAAFKKNDKSLAFSSFQKGIRAHMEYAGVTTVDIDTYLTSAALPQSEANLELKHILMQKYIALYAIPEAWSDLRRYNYSANIFTGFALPTNLLTQNNGNPAHRCLAVSFSEYDWNLETVIANGGTAPDYHTKPIWAFTNEE